MGIEVPTPTKKAKAAMTEEMKAAARAKRARKEVPVELPPLVLPLDEESAALHEGAVRHMTEYVTTVHALKARILT